MLPFFPKIIFVHKKKIKIKFIPLSFKKIHKITKIWYNITVHAVQYLVGPPPLSIKASNRRDKGETKLFISSGVNLLHASVNVFFIDIKYEI